MTWGIPVGQCGVCGGVVSVPEIWHGTQRPPRTCESCGRVVDESADLPVLPMQRRTKWLNVECVELHVGAGWPSSARPLLPGIYRRGSGDLRTDTD